MKKRDITPRGRLDIVLLILIGLGAGSFLGQAQDEGVTLGFDYDTFYEWEDEAEGGVVEVRRTGDEDIEVSVDYAATEYIARADIDFVPQSGTLVFAPGETLKSFTVPFLDDGEPEGSEPVLLTLNNASGNAFLGELQSARLYIQDNENRGSLIDWTFRGASGPGDIIDDVVALPDGKTLVIGEFGAEGAPDFRRVVKFNADGTRDEAFSAEAVVTDSIVRVAKIQADGKILIGGDFTSIGGQTYGGIARLNADGTLDPDFNPGAGIEGAAPELYVIAVQPDGKILLGGAFDTYRGVASSKLVRINPDGSIDDSFDLGGGIAPEDPETEPSWISAILVQPDGKILVSGRFVTVDGEDRINIARLDADGSVDPTFQAGGGTVNPDSSVEAMARQADGKILVGGDFFEIEGVLRHGIARLDADGSLDVSFDPGEGVVREDADGNEYPGLVNRIFVDSEGKILLTGGFRTVDEFTRPGIGRLLSNGRIDPSFGPYWGTTYRDDAGYVEFRFVNAAAVRADGKIVVGAVFESNDGSVYWSLSRLLAQNSLAGSVEVSVMYSYVPESDETAEVAVIRRGPSDRPIEVDYAITGLTAADGLDFTGGTGRLEFAELQTESFVSIPLLADDLVEEDETFEVRLTGATTGVSLGDPPRGIVTLVDSLRSGNPDFSLTPVYMSVRNSSVALPPVSDFAIQEDGKVLVSGFFTFFGDGEEIFDGPGLFRLEADGTLDETFDPQPVGDEIVVEFTQIGVLPDGDLVGGRRLLRKLDDQGGIDDSFVVDTSFVNSLAPLPDGRLLVANFFTDPNSGEELNEVFRVQSDGDYDNDFLPLFINDWVMEITPLKDGDVVLGGWFRQVEDRPSGGIVRLNEDGTFDDDFDSGTGIDGNDAVVLAVLEQPDGKLLLGGQFTSYDGIQAGNLVRLNPDGSYDKTFETGLGCNLFVSDMALQEDGKILLGGAFSEYNAVGRTGLARINPDGSLDETFSPELESPTFVLVSALEIQADGQIWIGGIFDRVNGIFRSGVTRLNGGSKGVTEPPATTLRLFLDPTDLLEDQIINLSFVSEIGREYVIEVSENLTDWEVWKTLTPNSERTAVDDQITAARNQRFYRLSLR